MDKRSTRGLYVATTTPLLEDGTLNVAAIRPQISFLLDAGIDGIVSVGGTGEASALTPAERVEVVAATVEAVQGRVPVLAGITAPGLGDAVELGRRCLTVGADALMVLTPYGTSPSQLGIRDYYKAVADGVGQSVMLYDIPYLTMVATQPSTVRQIAEDGSIFAMKASNPDLALFQDLVREAGNQIAIMAGDEDMFVSEVALGAAGGILASCNVLPRIWLEIFQLAVSGSVSLAEEKHGRIREFLSTVYSEPNPGPLKAAQRIAGFDAGPVRAPNRAPSTILHAQLHAQLEELLAYEQMLCRQITTD